MSCAFCKAQQFFFVYVFWSGLFVFHAHNGHWKLTCLHSKSNLYKFSVWNKKNAQVCCPLFFLPRQSETLGLWQLVLASKLVIVFEELAIYIYIALIEY